MRQLRIGIDLMGGEHSPIEVFRALLKVIKEHNYREKVVFVPICSNLSLEQLEEEAEKFAIDSSSWEAVFSEDVIELTDSPLIAFRKKKKSSMGVGIELLQQGFLDSFISTGNTGALLALSRYHLNLFKNVKKPALLVKIPTFLDSVIVLDVGANLSVSLDDFINFSRMGIAYRECVDEMIAPRLGFLNVGNEEKKGTTQHRAIFKSLQEKFKTSFLGNVEGVDVFRGKVDVLVTDGFTGNVFLKTAEGVFGFLMEILLRRFQEEEKALLLLQGIKNKFNYSIYPGSLLCGVDKIVIKCHSYAGENSLYYGIRGAVELTFKDIVNKLATSLDND